MDNLIKRLTDLLKIKNIITLMSAVVFMVLALNGSIGTDNVMIIITSVFAYFFNKNVVDNKGE